MSNTLESHPESLRPGQAVFLLGYHDCEMRLPFVEAYVYLGTYPPFGEESKRWYFKQADAFLRHPLVNMERAPIGDDVLSVDIAGLGTLVDWVGLVAELAERLEHQRRL